jgi:hypothetical protein
MGLTFGAAQIGAAMMRLAKGDGPAPRRGTLMPAPALLRARSVRQR